MLFIRMLKNASGQAPWGQLVAHAGEIYKVTQDQYDYLRAAFACRQLRDTEAVRKRAKSFPQVAGGGDKLFEKGKKAEEEFIDAPLPEEPPPSAGIIEPVPKGSATIAVTSPKK